MAYDDNIINAAFATSVTDSFNSFEDNSEVNETVVTEETNEDNSVNDSGNAVVDVVDSGNTDSNNVDNDWLDSGNIDSFNTTVDASDNSVNDDSINAGVRSYNLGFGDVSFGGAAGAAAAAGGDVMINNQNTVFDQSVNQNIAADGAVDQAFGNSGVIASGDDSIAAGGDFSATTTIDQSTDISAGGDVLIDSEKSVVDISDSYNVDNFEYTETNTDITVDIADSWNTVETNTSFEGSFNDESLFSTDTDITADVDLIVGSDGAVIGDDWALGL